MEEINSKNDATSVYTQEENANLSKMKDVRMAIIDHMTKDGVPIKTSELRVLNEIISAQEASIHTTVGNRIKFNATEQNGQIKEMVVEVLKQTAIQNARLGRSGAENIDVGNVLDDAEMVSGEMEISPDELNIKDFMYDSEEISYESDSDDDNDDEEDK